MYYSYSSRLRPIYKGNSSCCLEMDAWYTFHVGRGQQVIQKVSLSGVLKLHYLFTLFLKDINLICLGNQNTSPLGFFQRTVCCPSFTKANLRKIIFWRIVCIICSLYIPLDQFYSTECSVVMEILHICANTVTTCYMWLLST